jgi:hypothetical protein
MRVTASLWVGAYLRRCNAAGAAAVVARRGAAEAGAIFVTVDRLDGTIDLYGPAPQSMFDEARPDERLWQRLAARADADAVAERLKRERKFDPDIWIVAVEDRDGRSFLEAVLE